VADGELMQEKSTAGGQSAKQAKAIQSVMEAVRWTVSICAWTIQSAGPSRSPSPRLVGLRTIYITKAAAHHQKKDIENFRNTTTRVGSGTQKGELPRVTEISDFPPANAHVVA
jgi:hypothetical protein